MSHILRWTGLAALIALVFIGSCQMLSIPLIDPGDPDALSSFFAELHRGDDLMRRLEATQALQHAHGSTSSTKLDLTGGVCPSRMAEPTVDQIHSGLNEK